MLCNVTTFQVTLKVLVLTSALQYFILFICTKKKEKNMFL